MRHVVVLFVVVVVAAALPTSALAVDGVLSGAAEIFVWRDKRAMEDGMDLIRAGAHTSNPGSVARLLACIVKAGTRATYKAGGLEYREVLVLDGTSAGCRGVVPAALFKR